MELDNISTSCPYCGEAIDILVDYSVPAQQYIEDCSVCCRPMVVEVDYLDPDAPIVIVKREDD